MENKLFEIPAKQKLEHWLNATSSCYGCDADVSFDDKLFFSTQFYGHFCQSCSDKLKTGEPLRLPLEKVTCN